VYKPGRSDGCLDGGLMRPCFGHDARRAMAARPRGMKWAFFFLVPVSGVTIALLLGVELLFAVFGWFAWVIILSFVLLIVIAVLWQLASERFWAREWERMQAAEERRLNPVQAAIKDYQEACAAIDRGF
jgi:hypothetical protein